MSTFDPTNLAYDHYARQWGHSGYMPYVQQTANSNSFSYTFPIHKDLVPKSVKEKSMFEIDVVEFYDGTFEGVIKYKGKIVGFTGIRKTREKALNDARKAEVAAVTRMMDVQDSVD